MAEHEAAQISSRTKAALAASKARGTKLGGWRGNPVGDPVAARAARATKTAAYVALVGPIAAGLHAEGMGLHHIARQLTETGIRTPRGASWTATGARRLLARVEAPAEA